MGESQLAGALDLAVLFNVQPRLQQVLQNERRGPLIVRRDLLLLPPAPNGRLDVVLDGQLVDAGLRRCPAGRVSLHGARNHDLLGRTQSFEKTKIKQSFCFLIKNEIRLRVPKVRSRRGLRRSGKTGAPPRPQAAARDLHQGLQNVRAGQRVGQRRPVRGLQPRFRARKKFLNRNRTFIFYFIYVFVQKHS